MNYLLVITILVTLISFFADKAKTLKAIRMSIKKMVKILPAFFWMLIFMSIALYIFSEDQIRTVLVNNNIYYSLVLAISCGSVAIIPGFIAFPLSGILQEQGVAYMVLSGFTTTLMMVGIVTFPIEKEYLGVKLGIIRNIISLIIALMVALGTGIVYGELF